MLILIAILILLVFLASLLNSFLLYKSLPAEKQQAVVRINPLYKSKTKVKEWTPPKSEEEEAANKVQSNL